MINKNILREIKKKIMTKPLNIIKIDEDVFEYKDVIQLWEKYKKNKNINNYNISFIFNTHLNDNNHIILYHSKNKKDSLLLCKINNNYINILIPYIEINNKSEKLKKTNFIAFYK